jgi:hypothetical protein
VRSDVVELAWVWRFWMARWRGWRTAQLIRDQREAEACLRFGGAHALRDA